MRNLRNRKTKKRQTLDGFGLRHYTLVALLALLVLPACLMVATSIRASHFGTNLLEVEKEISSLQSEIRSVRAEVIKKSSLTSISENAQDMGFYMPENIIYITKESPVARLQ